MRKPRLILLALGVLAALTACVAATTGPRLFLLEAPTPATDAATALSATVGLREVALPLYARRDRIAAAAGGAIIASDDDRWAEEPPRAVTRLLARRLTARLGATVYVEPWPPGAAPDVVVSVEVDRFIGALGGGATLDGQATLVRADRRGAPETASFTLEAPVTGEGYAGLVGAYGGAVAELGTFLADALVAFDRAGI